MATAQHPRLPLSDTLRSPALLAWLRMARVVGRIQRGAADQLRQADLTLAQLDVLAQVSGSPGCSQQELAERLLVTQGNICQLLDALEKKSLVERRREGRTNRIFLSQAGFELASQVVPDHENWLAQQMGQLSEEEQKQLVRLARKLDRAPA